MDTHDTARHPIRVAAERAGLTTELLRAWERRYEAVVPGRAAGGSRLYTDADINRLSILSRLSKAGRSVGALVNLAPAELERLLSEDAGHNAARPASAAPHLSRSLEAARAMDSALLTSALRRAVLSLGMVTFIDEVLAPLIQELGEEWHRERLGIAREHAATATIEHLLAGLIRELVPASGASRLLLATPAGERHALGSMIAGALAAHDEWHVTWIGVDVPADQIAAGAERDRADVVALGIVASDGRHAPHDDIRALRDALPSRVPLLVGGSGAASLPATAGVTLVRGLTQWRALLRRHSSLAAQ